jgi:crotonobetainyl-CoA:carnitine CoA-transferase CaiB-like acyl-CoA transferase
MALLHRERSGRGQVVDVSMTAGAAYLATLHNQLLRMTQQQQQQVPTMSERVPQREEARAASGADGSYGHVTAGPAQIAGRAAVSPAVAAAGGAAYHPGTGNESGADSSPARALPPAFFGCTVDTPAPFLQPGFAPYYDCYAVATPVAASASSIAGSLYPASTRFVAVGAIEPQFFAQLMHGLATVVPWPAELGLPSQRPSGTQAPAAGAEGDAKALSRALLGLQHNRGRWPALRRYFETTFAQRDLAFWTHRVFHPQAQEHAGASSAAGPASAPFADACVTPVLLPQEASAFLRSGAVAVDVGSPASQAALVTAPLAAPVLSASPDRFRGAAADVSASASAHTPAAADASKTAAAAGGLLDKSAGIVRPGSHTLAVLRELGLSSGEVESLLAAGVVAEREQGATGGHAAAAASKAGAADGKTIPRVSSTGVTSQLR